MYKSELLNSLWTLESPAWNVTSFVICETNIFFKIRSAVYLIQLEQMHGQVDQQLPADYLVSVHIGDELDFWAQPHDFAVCRQAPDSSWYSERADIFWKSFFPGNGADQVKRLSIHYIR